jgi:O-antigen polymerase
MRLEKKLPEIRLPENRLTYRIKQGIENKFKISGEIIFRKFEVLLSKLLYNYIPFICLALIALVLPPTHSRAAWLSVTVATVIILLIRYNIKNRLQKLLNTRPKQIVFVLFAILIVSGSISSLYYFKKNSADGRLLIWKSTAQMIVEKPVWGFGFGKYEANYMDYQGKYFNGKEDSEEAYLADEINYAYNTVLKLTAELGILGLIVIGAIFYFIFREKHKNNGSVDKAFTLSAKMGLLGILVFSMFSYPEHILSIKIIFITLLAIISNQSKSQFPKVMVTEQFDKLTMSPIEVLGLNTPIHQYTNTPRATKFQVTIKTALLILIISTIYFSYPVNKNFQYAHKTWIGANWAYKTGAYEECLADYEKAFPVLKNNGQFLLNYGKALSMAEKHNEAVKILNETENYLKTQLYIQQWAIVTKL